MSCPIIQLAQQLIRCPSISPNDAGCQKLIIQRLQAIGFTVEKMDSGDTKNFWAWHGQGETFVFSGHTDVVPPGDTSSWITPPFEPTIRGKMLFGRGAVDMKGALAAMVVATERFIFQHPNHRNRLAFLITSDEESDAKNGTSKVVEKLVERKERLDYCLIGEPSSEKIIGDVIKNGRRGSLTCNLKIYGIQGHVAYAHLAENPIHRIVPLLHELIIIEWDHGNEFFPPTTMQITNIKSGIGRSNITPGELFLQFNFRFSTEVNDEKIKARVEALLEKYQLRYEINWSLSGDPFLTPPGKLLDATIDAIVYYHQIQPKLLTTGGTSDGRFISKMGAQVIELGLLNKTMHRINEFVNITDLKLLSRIYQRIIELLLS